jgi:hypothetical protein
MGIDLHLSTCVDTQSPKYLEMAQVHISLSLLLHEACPSWASGESKVCSLLEGTLRRDVNSPGSAVFA